MGTTAAETQLGRTGTLFGVMTKGQGNEISQGREAKAPSVAGAGLQAGLVQPWPRGWPAREASLGNRQAVYWPDE